MALKVQVQNWVVFDHIALHIEDHLAILDDIEQKQKSKLQKDLGVYLVVPDEMLKVRSCFKQKSINLEAIGK